MRLRLIILVLSLLAFLSASTGGFLNMRNSSLTDGFAHAIYSTSGGVSLTNSLIENHNGVGIYSDHNVYVSGSTIQNNIGGGILSSGRSATPVTIM